jgi:GTP-binding protein EngB required for normal cell division
MNEEIVDILTPERQQHLLNEITVRFHSKERRKQISIEEESIPRNVLVIGRQKSGKTTFVNMMANPTNVSEESTLLSRSETVVLCKINSNRAPRVTFVDTAGFVDQQNIDEQFERIQQQCKKINIDTFHLICYCTSIEDGIHQPDIIFIRAIVAYFGKRIKPNLCMIITRCESKMKKQLERYHKQITEDVSFKDIIYLFERGIHFSGSLKYDDWNHGNDSLIDQFENIYNYRENLFDLIKRNIEPFKLSTLSRESTRTPPTLLPPQPVSSTNEISSIVDNIENGYVYILALYRHNQPKMILHIEGYEDFN